VNDITPDLLLKEIEDEYVRENFWRLKLYLEQLQSGGTTIINSGGGSGTSLSGYKNDTEVDAPLVLSREITLTKAPETDTEGVYLNGLLLTDDCYSLSGNILTIDVSLPIEVGDLILVRYLA